MRKMAILQNASKRGGPTDSGDHDESEVNEDGGFSTPSMMYRTPKASGTSRDSPTQASPKTAPSNMNKRDVGGEKNMSAFGQKSNADDGKKDVPQGLAKEVRNFLKKLE